MKTIALTLALFVVCSSSLHAAEKPNVVVMMVDDLGSRDAGCYGAEDLHTPNIDRLAGEGVRFTRSYVHKVCCPARAMLMTGRYPQRANVNTWVQGNMNVDDDVMNRSANMHLEETTMAEMFKSAGYDTALFGKWHLGAGHAFGPTKQGFDRFIGHRGGFIDNYNHHFLHGTGYHDLYDGTTEIFHRGEYFPDLMTAEALSYLDEDRDAPFFMYVAFNLPHYPEQADGRFDDLYEDLPEPRRSYAKVVTTVDDRIGRILNKLDEKGITDDTIVLFLSDNGHSEEDYQIRVDNHTSGMAKGDNYGANGGGGFTGTLRGCKGTFFEGGIRTPCVLRYNDIIPAGETRNQMITACDWLPTLAEMTGVDAPKTKLDGKSIVAVIEDNEPSPHKTFHWQWQKFWAVIDGDWKLIHDGSNGKLGEGIVFLGRLDGDMPESKNFAEEKPELVRKLTDLHEAWAREVGLAE